MPLTPDFQDPSPVPNYPPYFVDSFPFFETTGFMPPQTFTVQVADPNPGDTLYVRWASDYPPFLQRDSLLLVDTMLPQTSKMTQFAFDLSVMNSPNCIPKLIPGDHSLVVILSDRPFLPPDQLTNDPEHRYNVTVAGTSLTMSGWSVVRCP